MCLDLSGIIRQVFCSAQLYTTTNMHSKVLVNILKFERFWSLMGKWYSIKETFTSDSSYHNNQEAEITRSIKYSGLPSCKNYNMICYS